MCGRYKMTVSRQMLERIFGATGSADFTARDQVFPTQTAPVLVQEADEDGLSLLPMEWGFVPFYECSAKPRGLINTRSETVAEKAAFRSAFATRRCIIPAEGFYEWEKKSRARYYYAPKSGLFALAGLWQAPLDGRPGFTILTTQANGMVAPVHDRMPVILSHNAIGAWLSAESSPALLHDLMQPLAPADMQDENQGRAGGSAGQNSDQISLVF